MMYHMLWVDLRKGRLLEGYATADESRRIEAKNYVQIIYIREIAVSKASE